MTLSVQGPPVQGLLDNFNGLPTHPLVIHAVLALVVLTAVGGVLSALPRWRGWMLPATAVVGVLAAVSTLLAIESGESLQGRLPRSELIEQHSESGERSRTVAIILAVLIVAWWLVERALRRALATRDGSQYATSGGGAPTATRTAPAGLRIGSLVLAVVTVLVSLVSAYLIYQTGEQGARAVWHDVPSASSAPAGDQD